MTVHKLFEAQETSVAVEHELENWCAAPTLPQVLQWDFISVHQTSRPWFKAVFVTNSLMALAGAKLLVEEVEIRQNHDMPISSLRTTRRGLSAIALFPQFRSQNSRRIISSPYIIAIIWKTWDHELPSWGALWQDKILWTEIWLRACARELVVDLIPPSPHIAPFNLKSAASASKANVYWWILFVINHFARVCARRCFKIKGRIRSVLAPRSSIRLRLLEWVAYPRT